MRFEPERHHRRSIRLKGYDYSQPGAYFITICTQDRACLFGEVVDGKMGLNDAGRMVQDVWSDLLTFYPGVQTDAFIVMPNHIHGIVILVGAGSHACANTGQTQIWRPQIWQPQNMGQPRRTNQIGQPRRTTQMGQPRGVAPTMSLPDVVHRFKTMTTKRYIDGVKQFGWTPFRGRLWQRNYYEHIIRNEESRNRIRDYILTNPLRWALDQENPYREGVDPFDEWINSSIRRADAIAG